jgi:hypothetical protein
MSEHFDGEAEGWRYYHDAIVCIGADRQGNQAMIFLNSCFPVYMMREQSQVQTEFEFFKVTLRTAEPSEPGSTPCPTLDTHIVPDQMAMAILARMDTQDVTHCASYNDILAVRTELAKASRSV